VHSGELNSRAVGPHLGTAKFASEPAWRSEPPVRFALSLRWRESGRGCLRWKKGLRQQATGGNDWEALTKGLPQSDCYVDILLGAMAIDQLDPSGVYFGTTGGQVYGSADAGDSWAPIVRDLPAVLSVEAQTLP
jgi:hypothetical protein